jgi:hypothetical protein
MARREGSVDDRFVSFFFYASPIQIPINLGVLPREPDPPAALLSKGLFGRDRHPEQEGLPGL